MVRVGDKSGVVNPAYRFVIEQNHADELQNLVEAHHNDYDIELVARKDLSMSTLSGEQAFDTIIKQFGLTPGLRLSDEQVCYGRQSGEVFVTSLLADDLQQYQLIAKLSPRRARITYHQLRYILIKWNQRERTLT